jgi:hypothetical protein
MKKLTAGCRKIAVAPTTCRSQSCSVDVFFAVQFSGTREVCNRHARFTPKVEKDFKKDLPKPSPINLDHPCRRIGIGWLFSPVLI